MGGRQSQPVMNRPLPGPNNAIKTPPPPNALIVGNVYTPRKIPVKELQSSIWSKLVNEKPVYVAIEGIGVSVTGNMRVVGGKKLYAVHKLHPLSPQNDIRYRHYLEVPESINRKKIVYDLKYAIKQLWPAQDYVEFITDEGTTFSLTFTQLKNINDPNIHVAIEAIKKDYPQELDPILSFRQVETPEFETYDDDGEGETEVEQQVRYTTLTPSGESKALFKAFQAQRNCMKPKPKPKPIMKPRTATLIFPNCENLNSGLSNKDNVKDFEDVSGFSNKNQAGISSEYSDESEEYVSDEYSQNELDNSLQIGNIYEY